MNKCVYLRIIIFAVLLGEGLHKFGVHEQRLVHRQQQRVGRTRTQGLQLEVPNKQVTLTHKHIHIDLYLMMKYCKEITIDEM